MNEIIRIAVPGGRIVENRPLLRLVVVPKLSSTEGLAQLGNWAERVTAAEFQPVVELDGTPVVPDVVRAARPEVWSAFFPPDTTVTGRLSNSGPRSGQIDVRRSGKEEQGLQAAYGLAAKQPDDVASAVSTFLTDRTVPPVVPISSTSAVRPRPDFQEIVAGLRDQPLVLRALGLVVDLLLPAQPLPESGQVRITWPDDAIAGRSPATAYVVHDGLFLPASSEGGEGPRIAGGMVDLRVAPVQQEGTPGWRLTTIDIDHSVSGLESIEGPATRMPAPRSAGLVLLRDHRHTDLQARVQRGLGRGVELDQEVLDAEDLLLGYRLDVRIQGRPRWFSISPRVSSHHINGIEIVRDVNEDVHLKPHAVQSGGDETAPMVSDEIVARWSGESIAATGASGRSTVVEMPEMSSQPQPRWDDNLPFEYRFEVTEPPADSQLPLRFGQSYEMRARVADLAGGGVGIDDPVNSLMTDAVTLRRHEPVPPPTVILPADASDLGPGGAPQTLVVRSDRGLTAAALAGQGIVFPDNSQRVLRPPATSPRLAELHGLLDGHVDEAWSRYRRAAELDGESPLPDPMSHGLQFRFPGTNESSSIVWPGGEQWPEVGDLQLRLEALPPGTFDLSATDIGGAVVLQVPQGETLDLSVWSWLQEADQPNFQLSHWLSESDGPAVRDFSGDDLVTPATTIRLVHAVRKPLRDPAGPVVASRAADATTAELTPTEPWLGIHRGSTAQLVISASWDEWFDRPDSPAKESVELPPVTVPAPVPGEPAEPAYAIKHDFGDPRRRDVTYTVTAGSRYREYFGPEDPGEFTASATLPTVIVPNAGIPTPVRILSAVPAFSWDGPASFDGQGEFRLTRRARRLRLELDRPWYSTGAGEQLGVIFAPAGQPAGGLTEVARDPLWRTNIPQLDIESLAPAEVQHPVNPEAKVRVVGVPVWSMDGHWYADVMLPVTEYAPLVRLAVARYQPESVTGRHLSAISHTDFLPLFPDRSVRVVRDGNHLLITLEGVDPGPGVEPLVTATIEGRRAGSGNDLTAVAAVADDTAWKVLSTATGRIHAPTEFDVSPEVSVIVPPQDPIELDIPAAAGLDLRLVVREAEHFPDVEPVSSPDEVLRNRTTYLVQIPLV